MDSNWNMIDQGKILPPESKNQSGIGTRLSEQVLVLFKSKLEVSDETNFYRVAYYDFVFSNWYIKISPAICGVQVKMTESEPIAWKKIKLTKDDRPMDGQKIKWTSLDGFKAVGLYVEQEDMFTVGFEDEVEQWSYGNEILEWLPI
jgi:hypothetical protein